MKTTNEILAILHEFKQTTADKYGIESLALVGSAARGEQRENSDIDGLRKTTQNHLSCLYDDQGRIRTPLSYKS